ncbi:Glutathione hydrolase proenzyme [Paraconexibacter sp. AEG42_29]|uniref:Glutathione hydrolase proenzyme n=1 Tax=Paraconexibacter sp. AEG42_29 TaxID=2997339 RepID=A0AAU7AUQ2_9ACTN
MLTNDAGRALSRTALGTAAVLLATAASGAPARAAASGPATLPQQPVAYGTGGGAATMSPYATASAIDVLKRGGNAVDGAVAAAATLGVSEPFVAGPGGGGYFVYYRARDRKVFVIDGRETAPAGARPDMFLGSDGKPADFEQTVQSGLSVGVPGNVATWDVALKRFGTRSLAHVLKPASSVARRGYRLDRALVDAIAKNRAKLARFPASAKQFLPGGNVPAVGHLLRNPDLATTYDQIGRRGARWFYTGPIAAAIARTVQHPPATPGTLAAAGGSMTPQDLARYTAPVRDAVGWTYRGYRIHGMPPSSSGGTTVGEAMNILGTFDQSGDRTEALHRYLEASKLAYADRGQFLGDSAFVNVPVQGLLSTGFAKRRAGLIGPSALTTPVAPGDPAPFNGGAAVTRSAPGPEAEQEQHTNHLVVADKDGNVVSYTNTIEQIAGSGITVAGRGFLLNNELTDFNFPTGTANSVAPGKRPRSSMSPTIVTRGGRVVEAIGSPGGATIITTVLQTLLNQLDFGMSLPEAIAAPRASQRNGARTEAEPAFINTYGAALQAKGQAFTPTDYIGIVAGLSFLPGGRLQTATESWRGGGGSAMVVRPENPDPTMGAGALGG